MIVRRWGSGKLKTKKSRFYEQINLQLNIKKSKKFLGWQPTYNVKKSIEVTTDWYKKVLKSKNDLKITSEQIDDYLKKVKL